ncbi:hypothetical protein FRC05_006645 [Tulasnella sp. 425]|nr:hypothetical protein FRC05_006645 [Tulasnella sp. 425]
MTDTDKTGDTKELSADSASTAPTSVTSTSEKQSTGRSRESTSNYASSSSGASRGRPRTRSELSNPLSKANLEKRGYHTFSVLGKDFHVDKRWKFVRELGQGAYGIVVYVPTTNPLFSTSLSDKELSLAQDTISGENVAIKQVTRVFEKKELAKRALREIVLLRHFNHHENITGLIDMDLLSPDFNEIYLFMEPMEADLHQIIRSGQNLTNAHIQYFLYQILRGCKYIHSANVVHRDLKPGNLLVNADCELKICDLGLSRAFERSTMPNEGEESVSHMTEYVATRWYRAPEIMLSFKRYGPAIDVWSIGCILAELLGGKPIFKGKEYGVPCLWPLERLAKRRNCLQLCRSAEPDTESAGHSGGKDYAANWERKGTRTHFKAIPITADQVSYQAQAYIRSLPFKPKTKMSDHFPNADPLAIDLLEKMLTFDPSDRINVVQALAHPYLEAYHEIGDEPEASTLTEKWNALEAIESDFEYRKAIWKEVYEFRLSVRSGAGGAGGEDEMTEELGSEASEDGDDEAEEVEIVVQDVDVPVAGPLVLPETALKPDSEPPTAATATATAVPPDPTPSVTDAVERLALADSSAVADDADGPASPLATLPRTPLDPKPPAIPFPTTEDRPAMHNRAPSSSSTLRPVRSSGPLSSVDPYLTYARRSNSLIFTPATSTQPHRRLYSEHVERGDDGGGSDDEDGEYIVAMIRSRAPSTDTHAVGTLIRTLSTGGLNKLGQQGGKVGKADAAQPLTQADLPPSAMPAEFKNGRGTSNEGSK